MYFDTASMCSRVRVPLAVEHERQDRLADARTSHDVGLPDLPGRAEGSVGLDRGLTQVGSCLARSIDPRPGLRSADSMVMALDTERMHVDRTEGHWMGECRSD